MLKNLLIKRSSVQGVYRVQNIMISIKPMIIVMGWIFVMIFAFFSAMTIKAAPINSSKYDEDLIVPNNTDMYIDTERYSVDSVIPVGSITLPLAANIQIAAGDEILVINMQGNDAGRYETAVVASTSSNTLTLATTLVDTYDGTVDKIMIQRVPHYDEVVVEAGGKLTAHAWDGETGGVLFFRALTVTVETSGTIDMVGKGYRGGSQDGIHTTQFSYVGEGYQGGYQTRGQSTTDGGGGGGYTQHNDAGWGGGGGYGTPGQEGDKDIYSNDNTYGEPGLGGNQYGVAQLSRLLLGAGGGTGGHDNSPSSGRYGGGGGNGGGIIVIDASEITVGGTITADGKPSNHGSGGSGGGGGAGGSIWLAGETLLLGDSHVRTAGGLGFNDKGHGGNGRIWLDYSSLTGVTYPVFVNNGDIPIANIEIELEKSEVYLNESIDAVVSVIDINGIQAYDYDGTVQFLSSDNLATVPTDYVFIAGLDNGIHTFVDGFAFASPGQQVITVTDTISPSLFTTSTITVRNSGPVASLRATISPTTAFAGENVLQLVVEALDAQGRRAESYRGSIELVESVASTLPARSGSISGNAPDYTFTEADAGLKTFTFAFNEGGLQDVYVYDYYNTGMNTTSNQADVKEVYLWAEITPGEAFAGEPALVLTVEARDEFGIVWPGYRGQVELVESVASTLPSRSGSLKNTWDYQFTEADAGHATFTFAFNYSGLQNVRIYDWANSNRDVTSNSVDVKEVYLWAEISPVVGIAGDETLTLTVEARDEFGNVWPDYRGYIELVESASSTLPSRSGSLQNTWDYQFTEADAGQATFNFAYNSGGVHNVYIYDWVNSSRNVTTNDVAVAEIYLTASISPTTAIRGDEDFILLVEARDENGDLYPHYRGAIEFVPSASATLPDNRPPCCGDYADYTFTAADGGSASLPFAFNETGTQNVYVYDHVNGNRNATSNNVTVTEPPPPTPAPPTAPPTGYGVPQGLEPGGSIPYGFGLPVMAVSSLPSNSWQGYPDYKIPASEGAFYLSAGFSHRAINDFGWATYYTVNYLGWENPLTDQRDSGGGTDGGPAAGDDYAFQVDDAGNTWPISHGPSSLGLTLSGIAPANTKGVHLDVHAGGNAGTSPFVIGSNGGYSPASCNSETVSVGDPIDTRSGSFYIVERDLGVSTGCQGIDLRFERVYLSQSLLSDTPFGYGWTHNYNQEVITLTEDYVAVRRPRGEHLIFKDVGTDVYASFSGSPHMLVKRPGGGWALVDQDQYVDLFAADGKLIAQQDPNGNMVWLTYETATRGSETVTRLARVDAPGGRYLWFGYDYYDIDELAQVADHTGRTVQYDYDEFGFLDVVTDTMDAATTYHYNNFLVTSKTDPLGNTVFTNHYDNGGRVITQTNSMGEFLVFDYDIASDAITTTVTEQSNGAATRYVYGMDDGQLEKVIDPLGAVTQYRGHTDTRRPTEIEDALGHVTQVAYNERGWPTVVTDTLGNSIEVAYNNWAKPTVLTDTLGRTTQFVYDGSNLMEMIDPAGQRVQFVYEDQNGWQNMLTGIVNQAGMTMTLSYDAAGDMVALTDPLQQMTEYGYDSLGRLTSVTDALDSITRLNYDDAGRLLQVTDPLTGTIQYEYDALGNVITMTDQVGGVTTIDYVRRFMPATVTNAMTETVHMDYDAIGRPTTITDQLGNSSIVTYDLAGRPVTVQDALGNTTQMAYDALGNTTVITDANGHALTIEYDALSRPAIMRNALGQTISYTYNVVGNVTRITDAAGEFVTIDYDVLNRPITVTNELGHTTTFAYDILGQVIEETDGNGVVTRYDYDELSRLVEVIANYQPGQSTGVDTNVSTRYGYDPVGNLTSLTDPRNYVTQFSYDPMGRMLSMTDPLSRTMAYEYDPRGLIRQWTKADNTAITYDYNPLGQLTQLAAPDQLVQYFYDAAGRRTGMVDPEGSTNYELDAMGRPLTITLATGEAVSYRYDGVGNRTHTIYPDGKTVVYAYNDLNQVTSINDWDSGVTMYDYDVNSRPITITLPNDTVSSLTYDVAGNVTSIVHKSDVGQVIGSYSYSYDATGRRLGAVENGTTISYTYDAIYRLTDATHSNGNLYHYEYDAAGNRLLKQEPGETVAYTYDIANQLTHVGGTPTTLDGNGNLLSDGSRSYAYDDLDRLIQVTQGMTTTQYGYTGDGDRLWQQTDGVTTTFTLDLNEALAQVLAQSQGSALTTVNFLPGIGQEESGGTWTYFHSDALGSIRDLSDLSGNVINHVDYTPFGEVINNVGAMSEFGFTGEPQEFISGLVYLRARYYSPNLGRFLTLDTLIPDATNGQDWNRYTYVRNDLLNYTDPSGHCIDGSTGKVNADQYPYGRSGICPNTGKFPILLPTPTAASTPTTVPTSIPPTYTPTATAIPPTVIIPPSITPFPTPYQHQYIDCDPCTSQSSLPGIPWAGLVIVSSEAVDFCLDYTELLAGVTDTSLPIPWYIGPVVVGGGEAAKNRYRDESTLIETARVLEAVGEDMAVGGFTLMMGGTCGVLGSAGGPFVGFGAGITCGGLALYNGNYYKDKFSIVDYAIEKTNNLQNQPGCNCKD